MSSSSLSKFWRHILEQSQPVQLPVLLVRSSALQPRWRPSAHRRLANASMKRNMATTTASINGKHPSNIPKHAAVKEHSDGSLEFSAWQSPGPATFDFRSDTITTPTMSMLRAIQKTTLMDDVFSEDPTTNALEADLAALAGHEAGLLVMSGTMGNQVAIRSHLTAPPHSVLCDYRSHIANYEAGGISTLSGASLVTVHPKNHHHLTLEDVKKYVVISDNIHACPTKVISLENTLNGLIMPLEEVKRISQFARQHDIRLHLDGARIWEVVASGAGPLPDFTSLFDSVSMCFSKGLGAPIGSLLVGNKKFITQARRIRKMMGGGTRQAGIITAAARVAVEEQFGKGPSGDGGRLRDCHAKARRIGKLWESQGGKLTWPVETNMVWLDLAESGVSDDYFCEVAKEEGINARGGGRLVIHYQISDEALQRLERTLVRVLDNRSSVSVPNGGDAYLK